MKHLTEIDKLAKQAWGFAHNASHDYKTEHDAFTAKLAELVVRRVISVYNDSDTFKTSQYDDDRVLEYFGLE